VPGNSACDDPPLFDGTIEKYGLFDHQHVAETVHLGKLGEGSIAVKPVLPHLVR
jgi:hypothetical protein